LLLLPQPLHPDNATLRKGGASAHYAGMQAGANSGYKNCGSKRRWARVLSVVVHACARLTLEATCTLGTDNTAAGAGGHCGESHTLSPGVFSYNRKESIIK
jgi:hypothetical protein